MKQYQTVEPFMEPSAILKNLDQSEPGSLMSDLERGFLCGLIRDHRPKKIVEVGVAFGGTTAVILECARELDLDCVMYSVDLAERRVYHDKSKQIGYLIEQSGMCAGGGHMTSLQTHHLLLGKILPERLEEIGGGIDFLILDTTHRMPGEILDYIAAFPYLTPDAIVVLHDTCLHYIEDRSAVATSVLFQSVVADKFLNNQVAYPNIAAFQLNEHSPLYMTDMIAALILPWTYIPEESHLQAYGAVIEKYYNAQCVKLYEQAVLAAKGPHGSSSKCFKCFSQQLLGSKFQHILLYGRSQRGRQFLQYCQETGIKIDGFVVSDDHYPPKTSGPAGVPVYPYSRIPFEVDRTLIIQTSGSEEITQRLRMSNWRWTVLPVDC